MTPVHYSKFLYENILLYDKRLASHSVDKNHLKIMMIYVLQTHQEHI